MVTVALLPIGEELLSGAVTDTNSSWIAARLKSCGFQVRYKHTTGDVSADILQSLESLTARASIVIMTGGLGPTRDDVTKRVLLQWSGSEWVRDEATYARIRKYMEARGRTVNELNATQADVPSRARVLPNYQGTAPGLWLEKDGKIVISLPGVPYEMKALMDQQVLPLLQQRFETPVVLEKILHTGGIPESELALQLKSFEEQLPEGIQIAYLPEPGLVKVKLTLSSLRENQAVAEQFLQDQAERAARIIGPEVYARDQETLEEEIFQLLKAGGKTIAFAESCTGGAISARLVQVPGISAVLKGSVVSYSNEVKMALLGVLPATLQAHGAVSRETAMEMAAGVRKLCESDYAVSVTGIAGPDGGSETKPVGTVWIGVASEGKTEAFPFLFEQNRSRNIQRATLAALLLLRKKHLGILGDAAN
ncbi:MAG: competence/damage-inducible protein A [Bacteroidia bacterium]|nr:competence/damage-inducible protein A [Bacteroidia bacterium]